MPKKSKVTQPPELHDTFFRQLIADPVVAAEFIEQYLPAELVTLLDLATLKVEKDTFVDARLRKHFSDILFSVTLKSGEKITIYLLFEHKSHPDKGTRLQLLRYMVRIWEKQWKKKKELSPIVPIVFYHGVEKWNYTKQFADLIEVPNELKPFVPQFQHLLIDLSNYSDEQIRSEVWWQVGLLVMKHIFDDNLGQQLPRLMLLMRDLTRQESGMEMLQTVLLYIAETNKVTSTEFARGFATAQLPGGTELMETFAQRYRNEGRQLAIDTLASQWKEEGMAKGVVKGKIEAQRQTILRLLQKRFQPLEKQVSVYFQQMEKITDLQALTDLIDALLDVKTLAEFDATLLKFLPKPDEKA